MRYLRQSTAVTLHIGPLVDEVDFKTIISTAAAGVVDAIGIYKHGGTAIIDISVSTTMTHRADGIYTVTLSTSDTDTVGHILFIIRDDDLFQPREFEFMVIPANVYDSLIAGSDLLDISVAQLSGDATAAVNLKESAKGIVIGTAIAGTLSTTQMTTDLAETTDDHYNSRVVLWVTGTLAGQLSDITDYGGATKMLTFTAVTEAPVNSDTFVIL